MKRLFLLTLLTLGMLVPALAVDQSLVLYLPFDEEGATALDASSYKNDGTIVGDPLWVEGYQGTALEFVAGSHVSIPEIPQYDVSAEVSLLAWVKATTNPNWGRVIDKSQWQTSGFDLVLTQTAGLARLEFFVADTTSVADSTTVVMDGEWHFVTGTFGDKTLRVYVDGVLEGEATSVGEVDINPNDWPVMIAGESSANGGQQFFGTIDEAAMYDRQLSDAEVLTIFQNGMPVGELASSPQPQNEAIDVPRAAALNWMTGEFAVAHDVYLGTSLDDVTAADRDNSLGVLASQQQTATTYDPDGLLEFGQTYFWRVDEVNAAPDNTIFKGEIWSFTVEPLAYPIEDIVATSNASSEVDSGSEKTVDGSGLNVNDQHSTVPSDMWVGTPPTGELAYIQYDFDQVYKLCELQVWNYNVMFELMLGFGFKDVTIEYSENGADWTVLNDVVFAQGTAKGDYAANTTVDLEGVAAKSVRLTANSGHGMMGQFGLSEVRFLYTPVQAREAEPADGAADVSVDAVLDWRAGREAVSHEVYFGADAEALALIDTVTDSQYNPGGLDLATTYYWQISEVNEAEAISTWQGPLWSFATQAYLVVDDFESYDDEDNVIYESWVDGWVNETGSTVGYLSAPFAEQTIVNSGKQSMPLSYDNTGGISVAEVELALTPAQNWTQAGVTTLVVSFRGDLDNDDAQVYVKINGTKVTGGGSTTMVLWKQWNIDLASTGANLQNVTSVTIGVEGSGSGVIYVDDLRLYAAAPAVATPVDPGADGLVAQYAFENNATDGTGNGYDGTPMNDPFYEDAAGDLGRAMMFDGINDYVDLPIGTLIGSLTDMSVATWVNLADSSSSYQRIFDFGSTDTGGYMFLAPREGTTGPIRFAITPAGGTESIVSTTMNLPSGWHHLAVVIDSASMTASVYLDGALAASGATATLPQDLGTPTQNWLGRSQYEADGYFTGSLADFSIYNRALSAGEVSYLAGAR
jgi:concanavalin A-like lectin/glucanase superfamily protein/F5/8 type C domain-containing protein